MPKISYTKKALSCSEQLEQLKTRGLIVEDDNRALLYQNLKKNKDQKEIARRFSLNHIVFSSWIHSLAYIRNEVLFKLEDQ